jgi:hypothetical protein
VRKTMTTIRTADIASASGALVGAGIGGAVAVPLTRVQCCPAARTESPEGPVSPLDGVAAIPDLTGTCWDTLGRDSWPEPDMRIIDDDRASAPALPDEALPSQLV